MPRVINRARQQFERTAPSGARSTVLGTGYGWAEEVLLSSMKRVGPAIEARALIDELFNADPNALIVVAGASTPTSPMCPSRRSAGRGGHLESEIGSRALISAAQILVSWSHPGRLRSEAAFAAFAAGS